VRPLRVLRRHPLSTAAAAGRDHAEVVDDRALASRPARIVVLLFWLWLGWHFFVGATLTP
jgi:hypothetical protein